ncbi:cysteine synthase [Pedobacter ginsenosidimutans]|uniref:cysteine synthase n=1 Tax=Pedobacter ginsenosidimutans TaxID=687842 RepID=A0A0T5VL11_9SPHI|nr:PLP-dependent cysteine synthase family protein [Pedobacter ginsenosidimutans]KRT14572.1 cysteine synthase [Pedobacter ginsenosidimutans]
MTTITANKMTSAMEGKFEHLSLLIGNTPMLELTYTYQGSVGKIYVKCEHYNLTGSIKDRMALYTLKKAYTEGKIKAGDLIVEATSGNTGIAFAAIGKALGHPVTIIMPNWLSKERMDIIKSLGAEIILVSKEEGGFIGSIKLAEQMAANDPNIFLPKQFENIANPEAHEHTTGKEIWEQLRLKNLSPDAFVAGVGTGGTIMGVGNFLRKQNPAIKIHPLEPAESPTLTTGYKVGSHRIQGISDEFIPEIVKLNELDEVLQVNDGDAILMAQKLAEKLGLAVGISSGANVIGAIKQQQKMGTKSCVVTIFSDSNKKYLSTDLMKVEPVKTGYISPEVDFIDYQAFSRLH